MMAPSFIMKLNRADEHLEALDTEVASFLAIRPYEIVTQKDIPARKISAKVVYRQSPPERLLMLIGDAVHNLRSSLDNLAWSLAGTSANTNTAFPIFDNSTDFTAARPRQMHGMSAVAQSTIESLQPYNRRHGLPEHAEPLWVLHKLSIEDKHHACNLVASRVMSSVHISTNGTHPAYGLTGVTGFMPLEDGAEIFSMTSLVDQSQMQDYSRHTFDVAFSPKGPGLGIGLREGFRNMREAVAEAIKLLEPLIP